MSERDTDTIAAVITPPGRGGVGIVRLSGSLSFSIAQQVASKVPEPRMAHYGPFIDHDESLIDNGILLCFKAPHSYTGEDVVEFQAHGGPVVLDRLLQRCVAGGARLAKAGEYTERAFLNDKIDLAQAEAIADLIDAETTAAAKLAARSLQGEFSERIHDLVSALTHLRMYVEAAIDFPEEEIDFLSDGKVAGDVELLIEQVETLLAAVNVGRVMRDGMTLVIAGRPNAGKSSLLNALVGNESAIVTDIPGTTRDVVKEQIQLDGMPLHLIDTAGLRDSSDVVEKIGIQRAHDAIAEADRILWVYDGDADPEHHSFEESNLPSHVPVTFLHNKADKSGRPIGLDTSNEVFAVSAKQGEGIVELKAYLRQTMGLEQTTQGEFLARRRHIDAIERALEHIHTGKAALHEGLAGELMAEDLRQAQLALSEITGEFSADDLLGEIFAGFCIGK